MCLQVRGHGWDRAGALMRQGRGGGEMGPDAKTEEHLHPSKTQTRLA